MKAIALLIAVSIVAVADISAGDSKDTIQIEYKAKAIEQISFEDVTLIDAFSFVTANINERVIYSGKASAYISKYPAIYYVETNSGTWNHLLNGLAFSHELRVSRYQGKLFVTLPSEPVTGVALTP